MTSPPGPPRPLSALALGALALGAAASLWGCAPAPPPPPGPAASARPQAAAPHGPPLPAMELTGPDGAMVRLRPGRAELGTLVGLWSPTWDPHAHDTWLSLGEIHERWGNRGIRVLAVAFQEEPEAVLEAEDLRESLLEVAMGEDRLYEALQAEALPCTWILDPEGRVIERLEGYQPVEALEAALRRAFPPTPAQGSPPGPR